MLEHNDSLHLFFLPEDNPPISWGPPLATHVGNTSTIYCVILIVGEDCALV